jgi:hypothetical protein
MKEAEFLDWLRKDSVRCSQFHKTINVAVRKVPSALKERFSLRRATRNATEVLMVAEPQRLPLRTPSFLVQLYSEHINKVEDN